MEKKLVRFYILVFLFIILLISGILLLASKIKITGLATYNTGNSPCTATMTESSVLSENVICNLGDSGLKIDCGNCQLDCQGNYLKGTGGATIGIWLNNKSIQLINCNITDFGFGIYFPNTANDTKITDSYITSVTNSLLLDGGSVENILLNVTKSGADSIAVGANYTKQWYLKVHANYTDGSNVSSANVTVYNTTSIADYSGTTDANGNTIFNVTEYVNQGNGGVGIPTPYNIYNVTVTKNPANSTMVTVTGNTEVGVGLGAPPTPPPTPGNGGGSSCKDKCEEGEVESICLDLITLNKRTCGDYDRDPCLEWSEWNTTTCGEYQICENGNCTCNNQCNPEDYPQRDGEWLHKCIEINTCYILETIHCDDVTCPSNETEEIEEETPAADGGGGGGGIQIEIPRPSEYIPHGNVPDVVVDAGVYTGGAVVVYNVIHWSWIWLLTLLIPFFLLRLKHYCISLIDSNYIKLENKKQVDEFAFGLSEKLKDDIYKAEEKKNYYKYVFKNSGFLEILTGSSVVVNAHFTNLKRAEDYKSALERYVHKVLKKQKVSESRISDLTDKITMSIETTSIFSVLRSLSRRRKLHRLARRFR